jgi:hypothetical protein
MSRGGKRATAGRPKGTGTSRRLQLPPRTLEEEYANDPLLLKLYKKKLLKRGWAGKLTAIDREYRSRARRSAG